MLDALKEKPISLKKRNFFQDENAEFLHIQSGKCKLLTEKLSSRKSSSEAL